MQHPIKKFVGKTIEQISVEDDGTFVIKFTDGMHGGISIGMLFNDDGINPYKEAVANKRIFIGAGLYPEDFVPDML